VNGSYAALKTLPALFALLVVLTGALAQTSPREELPGLGPDGFVSVQSLALGDGQTIYAGSFGGGIFKSDDGGRSWQVANEGLSDLFVYVVMVAPDQTLYAGTLKGGVFRSRNSGKSWMAANAGLDRLETHVLMHHQGTLYAGTGSGVFRSKDQGDTWQSENEGLSNLLIRALVVDAKGMMYAGTTGMGIYRKPQGTSKWLRITQSQLSHPRDRLPERCLCQRRSRRNVADGWPGCGKRLHSGAGNPRTFLVCRDGSGNVPERGSWQELDAHQSRPYRDLDPDIRRGQGRYGVCRYKRRNF